MIKRAQQWLLTVFFFALTAVPVSGCAIYSRNDQGDFANAWRVFKAQFSEQPPAFTEQDVLDIPYATIGVRIADNPMALVVLKEQSGDKLVYEAVDRTVLVLRRGRIEKTGGFPVDLNGTEVLGAVDPFADGLHRLDGEARYKRSYDFTSEDLIGIVGNCKLIPREMDPITLFDTEHPTRRITERCKVDGLASSLRAIYWVDIQNGRIWKSRQELHPAVPRIEVVVQRPALGDLPGS